MANISNVITVTPLLQPALVQRDNVNVVMIITSQLGAVSSANRFEQYADIQSVANDFGTESDVYQHAVSFFATNPNSAIVGGAFLVGFWRAIDEDVPALPAQLVGGEVTELSIINQLQTVNDGSFDITVDGGVEQNVTGLSFQTVTTLDGVASVLNGAITGASVANVNGQMVITSDTTGVLSLLTFPTDPLIGTFLGNILKLSAGTGALLSGGTDAAILSAETKVAAITELKAQTNMYGAVFIDPVSGGDAQLLATWAQANKTLIYDVFFNASNLEIDITNPVWLIKLAGEKHYRMNFSKINDRKFATTAMARMHTVNFAASNSAITLNLKSLPITPEDLTQTEITKAAEVGLDVYVPIKNEGVILQSGANGFTDDEYNLLAYINAIEIDTYNVLKGTNTKIPQTVKGVNSLVDQLEKTSEQFVNAGVFAPGTWQSPDIFGDPDTFRRNIELNGFYFLAGSLSDQPPIDRQERKSPVIQGAVKFAGAIHHVDIIINFNL